MTIARGENPATRGHVRLTPVREKRGNETTGSVVRTLGVWCCLLGYSLLACICLPFDRRRTFYKQIVRACSSGILRIAGVNLEVRGLDHIDLSNPGIYVSNHASMLDMVCIIGGISEEIGFLYKKEMHRIPLFGWALRYGGLHYPIHRGVGSIVISQLKRVVKNLQKGRSVYVFPEGSRSEDGALGEFKDGAFYLARKTGAPIIPVTITGTFEILSRDSRLIRPGNALIIIDQPVDPRSSEMAEVKQLVRDGIMKNCAQRNRPNREGVREILSSP